MEIIGRIIPYLQSEISSGLESIASGIQQKLQVQGPAGINDAFDSFLPEQIGISGTLEFLPRVGDAAQFPDPIQYFQMSSKFAGPQNSNSLPNELIGVLKEKDFNPATELQGMTKK